MQEENEERKKEEVRVRAKTMFFYFCSCVVLYIFTCEDPNWHNIFPDPNLNTKSLCENEDRTKWKTFLEYVLNFHNGLIRQNTSALFKMSPFPKSVLTCTCWPEWWRLRPPQASGWSAARWWETEGHRSRRTSLREPNSSDEPEHTSVTSEKHETQLHGVTFIHRPHHTEVRSFIHSVQGKNQSEASPSGRKSSISPELWENLRYRSYKPGRLEKTPPGGREGGGKGLTGC